MWEYFHSIILWDSTRPAQETQKPMQSFPHCFPPFFSRRLSAVMRCCPVISHKMSQCQLYASPIPLSLLISPPRCLTLFLSSSLFLHFLFLCQPPKVTFHPSQALQIFLLCSGGPSEWMRDEADADRWNNKKKEAPWNDGVKKEGWWALSTSVGSAVLFHSTGKFRNLTHSHTLHVAPDPSCDLTFYTDTYLVATISLHFCSWSL